MKRFVFLECSTKDMNLYRLAVILHTSKSSDLCATYNNNEMMKQFLFIMALLSAVLCSCSKDDSGEGEVASKKNKVVTVTEYDWTYGEKSTYGELYEKFTYNESNLLTKKETHYYIAVVGSRIPDYYTYTYDDNKHLIQSTENGISSYVYKYTSNSIDSIATMDKYDNKGKLSESWAYTYDSSRRLLQAKQTYGSLICYVDDYTYNGNNVVVTRHRVDNGELFGTTYYEYDAHKNLLKKTWVNGETGKQSLEKHNEFTYNSNGSILKKTINENTYGNKSYIRYEDYTYNTDGSIKTIHKSYSYKSDESDLDYTYSYE